ncbi:cellular nucleic acid-binding protein homolog [Pecten maximus]|uniref:cellular nucleic acid-binding protein homolog n=1 Tax=Pecten maximus TaxID=6579 RepID=UPI0014588F7C|nr:cellular nucleic acid-binding protein homolog [Pecten maximus]
MAQQANESVDQYVNRLRQRAEFCDFENIEEQIRDQSIEKCVSKHLRRKLLERGRDLTLAQLQTSSRSMESSEHQAKKISVESSQSVNQVRRDSKHTHQSNNDRRCYRCDSAGHISSDPHCPAKGVECRKCKKNGHFAKCCRSKQQSQSTYKGHN